MSPGEADKPKTTREKKCPECGSENVMFFSGHGAAATESPPHPTRRLFQCQDCGKAFWYVRSLS